MPAVYFRQDLGAANSVVDVPLAPYDRFGGGGGRIRVRATVVIANAGNVDMTVMLGSDVLISAGPVGAEANVGQGPTNETPSISGIGAPGDPITVRLAETAGVANVIVTGVVDIQNA